MRSMSIAILTALTMLSLGVPSLAQPSAELPPEFDRVLRDYEKAWSASDATALAELFAPDGWVLSPGRPPVHGRAAIEKRYEGSGGPLALRAIHLEVDGNLAVLLGGYAREVGQPDVGKFTLTLRREGERWQILSDMDNSNERSPN